MKIAFFEVSIEQEQEFFRQRLPEHELNFQTTAITSENANLAKDSEIISTFVNCKVDQALIDALPNLKAVFARSTGFDNVDFNYCKRKGVKVYNVPTYGSHTVAEFTFGLILSLLRKIPQAVRRTKEENEFSFTGLKGEDIFNKTLGVIGTGKIGENVIKIARGFEMKVVAYDPFPKNNLTSSLGFEYTSLQNVLKQADIITLHAPYTKENHHLLNKENFAHIKQGAYLINTSRGALVDTDALVEALKTGHLAGAALDVLEEERELKEEAMLLANHTMSSEEAKKILEDHILIELPNVIVTPHVAFYSKEAEDSILNTTVENINSFFAGSSQNQVNA